MSAMDPSQCVVQISAMTTQPQFGVFQNLMAQNMPSLGQQPWLPQFQQMPGNFPGYFHNPAGIFMPAIQNPQSTPGMSKYFTNLCFAVWIFSEIVEDVYFPTREGHAIIWLMWGEPWHMESWVDSTTFQLWWQ